MSARRDTAPLPPLVRACVEAGYGTPARPLAAELFRRHPKLMGRHGLDGWRACVEAMLGAGVLYYSGGVLVMVGE